MFCIQLKHQLWDYFVRCFRCWWLPPWSFTFLLQFWWLIKFNTTKKKLNICFLSNVWLHTNRQSHVHHYRRNTNGDCFRCITWSKFTPTCAHTPTCPHTHTHPRAHTHTHTHVPTHTHTPTCPHTHTHTHKQSEAQIYSQCLITMVIPGQNASH